MLAQRWSGDGSGLNGVSGGLRPSEKEGRPLPAHGVVPFGASPNERALQGTLLTMLNYCLALVRVLETAEFDTPTCRATSASGSP